MIKVTKISGLSFLGVFVAEEEDKEEGGEGKRLDKTYYLPKTRQARASYLLPRLS